MNIKTVSEAVNYRIMEVEVIRETDKAVLVRRWHSSGCDPATNAHDRWFPKSVLIWIKKDNFHPMLACKTWWLTKENLYHFCG